MSIFHQVSKHVVEVAGATTLHPVVDINSAEKCKVLCIITKKESCWFWKSSTMTPTLVKLNDLVISGCDLDIKTRQVDLIKQLSEKSTNEMRVNISRDVEETLSDEFNFKIDGSNKIELNYNLGDMVKNEVSFEELRRSLQGHPIDISHPLYLRTAKDSSRTSLCIVIEELTTKSEGSIKEEKDKHVSVKAGANIDVNLKGEAEGSSDTTNIATYNIPPATVIAYACVEISADADGNIILHDREDKLDRETGKLRLPENPFRKIKSELKPLMRWAGIEQIRKEFNVLLSIGSTTDFQVMDVLFGHVNSERNMVVEDVKRHLESYDVTYGWKPIMNQFGVDETEGNIKLGKLDQGLRRACMVLVDSILCLEEEVRVLLPNISCEHARILMRFIKKYYGQNGSPRRDVELDMLLAHDMDAKKLLMNVGFREGEGGMFTFTGRNSVELLDLYVLLYFFSSRRKHCCVC